MRILTIIFCLQSILANAQSFYYGADISYTNEMEDCGAVYKDNGLAVDPFNHFAQSGCNLIRLRLWHNPSWHKTLNQGKAYSDLADVTKSIKRAKAANMKVLLDFHLSDTWADPSKQLVPAAWEKVVANLTVLQDSIYNYISKTLVHLKNNDALPSIIQIGNETNKGIVLSAQDDKVFTLDWTRNAALFNRAIKAIRDFEKNNNQSIKIAIHLAGPTDAEWLAKAFNDNGVKDFDIIGLSYYWAWHKPTTIADAGNTIALLKSKYKKDIIILETGYIWTTQSNDSANNIISEVHPSYAPASPDAQYRWLHDLTTEVKNKGGIGVCYWEPTWVSTSCNTQWGKGSHQEHAAFFDFKNNALKDGGFKWLNENKTNAIDDIVEKDIVLFDAISRTILLSCCFDSLQFSLYTLEGKLLLYNEIIWESEPYVFKGLANGNYICIFKNDSTSYKIKSKIIQL